MISIWGTDSTLVEPRYEPTIQLVWGTWDHKVSATRRPGDFEDFWSIEAENMKIQGCEYRFFIQESPQGPLFWFTSKPLDLHHKYMQKHRLDNTHQPQWHPEHASQTKERWPRPRLIGTTGTAKSERTLPLC